MKKKLTPTLVSCFCKDANTDGNPAAVSIDYPADNCEKQAIAVELNLPVVVFVSDAVSAIPLIEYFYPNKKMPLCLHGTLAAAETLFGLHGGVTIKLKTEEGKILKINKTSPGCLEVEVSSQYIPQLEVTPTIVTRMLTIGKDDIAPDLPLVVASVGSPKLLIPISSLSTIDSIKPDFSFIEQWSIENNINGIYVYSQVSQSSFKTRGFNPKTGYNEDAATGVAAAALSLVLGRSIVVYQGTSINKPCIITVSYQSSDSIWVGGICRPMKPGKDRS